MPGILHLIETGGPGGAENIFLRLLAEVCLPGFQNLAVVGREGWLAEQVRTAGVQPIIMSARGSLQTTYLRALMKLIRERDVRLVVAHLYGAAIYGSIAARICGVPVVAVIHGQSDIARRERFAWLKSRIIGHFPNHLVFVSEALRDDVLKRLRLPARRTSVIQNGIDLDRPQQGSDHTLRSNLPVGSILVGAVGNVRSTKGYETLLLAAKRCLEAQPLMHFLIAGDTSGNTFPAIARLSSELGLDPHVTFLGLRSDVPRVLANLDVYVLSSDTEGFSIALVEAMAASLPVIATRSGGPETIIHDGTDGVLVPPKDPQALASAILKVAADHELRERLRHEAKRAVVRYGSTRMIEQYRSMFEPLVSTRSR